MPLLACPAVFSRVFLPALLGKPAVAPFSNCWPAVNTRCMGTRKIRFQSLICGPIWTSSQRPIMFLMFGRALRIPREKRGLMPFKPARSVAKRTLSQSQRPGIIGHRQKYGNQTQIPKQNQRDCCKDCGFPAASVEKPASHKRIRAGREEPCNYGCRKKGGPRRLKIRRRF